jgi:hypothetical protein
MTVYFGIFKEPRGLIRLLQFIFAIFAFATACNGSSSLLITQGTNNDAIDASWSYPYHLEDTPIGGSLNTSQNTLSNANDIKPSAEFFVFTGVTSMLLALAFAVIYVLLDRQYRNDERFPIIDLVVTLIWTVFWIAGSAAWAQGVSNIRSQTDWKNVADRSRICPDYSQCTQQFSGTYANIIVSVIFGFLNFILWLGSVWFVFKETKFFKNRTAQQQQQQPEPQQNNFSNIGSPTLSTNQQQSQIRPPIVMS